MSPSDLLSACGALVLVVGLIFLLRYGARFLPARAANGSGGRLAIAAQLGLDSKRRLTLVQCDGHRLLVLTGGAGDMMLPWPAASDASTGE